MPSLRSQLPPALARDNVVYYGRDVSGQNDRDLPVVENFQREVLV